MTESGQTVSPVHMSGTSVERNGISSKVCGTQKGKLADSLNPHQRRMSPEHEDTGLGGGD